MVSSVGQLAFLSDGGSETKFQGNKKHSCFHETNGTAMLGKSCCDSVSTRTFGALCAPYYEFMMTVMI